MDHSSDTIYRVFTDKRVVPFIARTPSIQSMGTEIFLYPSVLTDRYYFMQTVKKVYDFSSRVGLPRTDLMYDMKENGNLKGKLKEIAASLDEESNPVLMIAKYKQKK